MKRILPPIIQPVLRARPYNPEGSADYIDRETAQRDADNFTELTGHEMRVVRHGRLFGIVWKREKATA